MRLLLIELFQRISRRAMFCLLVIPFGWTLASAAPSLAPSDPHQARDIVVNIKTRQFEPDTLYLQSGEKIRLILRNQDVELHAFVPISLFQNATLHVSGNGAPEFGTQGLLRILLPSKGQTEILFVPERPGSYPFLCDLPGHVMRGTVVVQE
jgi:plastocyanin